MTFQERMRVSPSNLEWMIRFEQQRREISDFYLYNQIIIFYPTACEIIDKAAFTEEKAARCILFTLPDQMTDNKCWAFYEDGIHHLTPHNSLRDARINFQLEKWGIRYRRWQYKRPTKHLMNCIVDEMEACRLG